jgi:gliding motility-associated-like protein
MTKKIVRKASLIFSFFMFLSLNPVFSQCTWSTYFFDSYEYTTVIPHIVPGSTYQNTPQTFAGCIHTGSRGLYLNIADGYLGMIYDQPFDDLCVGATYRFSMWTRDAWSSTNNFTFQVLSSTNQVLSTQNIITNSTWANVNLPAFVATTSSIRFQIITNTIGGPGNDGAVDDLTLSICSPDPVNYNITQCAGSGNIDLYPSINAPVLSVNGTWTGPTTLNNGYLGTFTPNVNTNGVYQYTIAGIGNCPDSVANLNVQLISSPNINPVGPIDACNFYVLPAITGTNLSNNANYYTAANGGGTVVPVGTSISSSQTLYMYAGTVGCSDEEPLVININAPGNAGSDSGGGFCGSGSLIDLNTFLSSGVTPGGTWSETTNPTSGTLNTNTGVWNSSGASTGNYTFQYTVPAIVGCVSDVASFVINIGNVPDVEIGNDTILCQGQTLLLNAGTGFDSYLWNNGSTGTTLNVNSPGTYSVIVNTLGANLIVNGDFELGNTGFSTDYNQGTGGTYGLLSNEGTYAVSSSPSLVHNNFSFCNDQTVAPGVNQLIVNGSAVPNENIWCQTIPVQPNTIYEFGAWVSSVVNDPALGQLQFSINNVPLGSIFSPSSSPCVWSQFTENWNSGTATSAQICITSQSLSQSGNDFALDDITFRPVCESQDVVVVQYSPQPVVNLGADQSHCSGVTVTLDAQNPGLTFLWNTTETSQTIDVTTSGNYSVTVTNAQNCFATDNVTLTFENLELAGNDTTITLCSTQTQIDLNTLIQPSATTGGVWSVITPTFNGQLNPNGTISLTNQTGTFQFQYTVTSAFCPSDNAIITLQINQQPEAATDQAFSYCNTIGTSLDFTPYINNPFEPIIGNWILPPTLPISAFNTSTNLLDLSNLPQGNYVFGYFLPSTPECVSDILNITVSITENPAVLFNADILEGCQPLVVNFTNQTNAQGAVTYLWDLGNGITSTSATMVSNTYETPQCYDVTLTATANGLCTTSVTMDSMICVYVEPVANFSYSPNELYSYDPTVQIDNNSINNDLNFWNFSDGGFSNLENPSYTFPIDVSGNYLIELIVTTTFGCTDTTTQIVEVKDELIYYVPNTFTPDGDEHNNIFLPVLTAGIDLNDYKLAIYNRWGELIFESYDTTVGWDGTYNGTIVQEGAYVWVLQFGLIYNDKDISLQGHVNLVR